ncbi:RNA-binding S4 domain-containing protein [Parerythrobacter lacustris]|uniref:RNA-binding S4 domain-containing protein n=1 Tax=Parerythrobacter lacustris TaxID=2969984 RepID=A0ABT1XS10_9SPHN|nr:RNA-binding S4 domain-containing protein [Parerythrobacter lacustris]MCR2834444.1 RNA-binding S4 domain-containing protein [Parerythrobacter lacustris]
MRIDLLLHRCRFTKTRSAAQALIAEGHLRCNGQRILRASAPVASGDILTIPVGNSVRVIELLALPDRRGPASEAATCYRVLDRQGESALAAEITAPDKGISPP